MQEKIKEIPNKLKDFWNKYTGKQKTIIIAVICVGAPFGRPSEIAELNRDVEPNKEEILAETVQAGQTYTVPEDGIYKIELHGGKGEGTKRTVKVVRLLDI